MLVDLPKLTVTTTSLRVADLLVRHENVRLRMSGGELRADSLELSGEAAVAYFERARADWALLEVDGVHPYAGLTSGTPTHVATMRAMLSAADRRCIMAPSGHFGAKTVGYITDVASVDLFVTDEALPDAELPAFAGRVVRAALPTGEDWRVDNSRYAP
jgi:DeoR/GlpR family transcriptional regulator of sugar metabolism